MMSAKRAAWSLKNELGNHDDAVAALRAAGSFLRIVYGPPQRGVWPVIALELADAPSEPPKLYRRADPEHASGIFWTTSPLAAFLHTADRFGLQMYEATFAPADLIAEFVMQDRYGRRSGGEFIIGQ